MILPAMRSFYSLARRVCVCVCAAGRQSSVVQFIASAAAGDTSCKGAVLSDTSHPALITVTHCYSRWLSGTASIQHIHTRHLRFLTPHWRQSLDETKIPLCVCENDGCHTQITLPLTLSDALPALIHTEIQTQEAPSLLMARCRQNMTLTRKNENNAKRNLDMSFVQVDNMS